MTILPSQKLSVGELFVSLAAGLMLFLLPNDAQNQFHTDAVCESFIFIISFIIIAVMFSLIKRYEAIGSALMTMSILTLTSTIINIINGIATKGGDYWPKLTEYNIASMFILWVTPFLFAVILRLLAGGSRDNNNTRRGFARFMMLSMRSLTVLYAIIVILKLIVPVRPGNDTDRNIQLMFFSRIGDCITGAHEDGIQYIVWHLIILIPFSIHLSVMIPKLRVWHILIIAGAFGLTIEALQYLFNTGAACTDDIIMYIVGAMAGILIKYAVNGQRNAQL